LNKSWKAKKDSGKRAPKKEKGKKKENL